VTHTANAPDTPMSKAENHKDDLEDYGPIEARHGYIPIWLLIVYFVLFAWGLYYTYHYWGGLGPGRIPGS
jgi:hypothetical protein